ncbi:MAG: hypothetical protein ACYCVL_09435 [Gemmatimonadaceae bacterium]
MPQQKKPVPPADERLKVGTPDEIRGRLSKFVKVKFGGNWAHFAETLDVPVPTVEAWKEARLGWPSFKHLWKLAEHGLSIDWLIADRPPMLVEYAGIASDAGKLLELLRPYAEQMAGVGEFTARQAFGRLLMELEIEGMLRKAAEPFVPRYLEVKRDVERDDDANALRSWVYDQLAVVDKRVDASDASGVREALAEMARRIEDSIPEWLRLNQAIRLQRGAIIEKQVRLVQEAQQRGWHPYAMTTAAEVAEQVQGAKRELEEVSLRLVQVDPEVVRRLKAIERTLSQLEAGVTALQSQREGK